MDWLLKRQFLSKACIPIRQYITRDRVAYTPAQECGLTINTACSHHQMPKKFSFSLYFFHNGIIERAPAVRSPTGAIC